MEIVDIVSENNQVLYQVAKDEAHAKGLLHRTIIAEVQNSNGDWLLVKQAPHKQDAGQFVSPVGGHIQAGEQEEDALKREAKEECGLDTFTFKRLGQFIYNREVIGRKEHHLFIVYHVFWNGKICLNDESVDYRWFSPDELRALVKTQPELFGDAYHAVLKTLLPELL